MTRSAWTALLALPLLAACSTTDSYQQPENPIYQLGETSSITGSLTYRERIALPAGSVATVTLEEVSRADAPATLVDRKQYSLTGVPFGFELRLPNRDMPQAARYSVRAQIHSADGRLLFTTDTVNPVMRRPVDQDLGEIVMVRAG